MNQHQAQIKQIINKLQTTHEFKDNLAQTKQFIETLKIHPTYPIILVGGTNGKGSTCAYLTHILSLAGYQVGTFTSPHVFEYNERISINNISINETELLYYIEKVAQATNYSLGIFKTFTLACHLYFIQQNINIAIIEVGIGGRQDVTNCFEPTISAITGVALDHCHILGNTIEQISLEKAHIYRHNKWAFYGSNNPANSLLNYAKSIGTKLQLLDSDFGFTQHELSFDVWCNNRNFYALPYPALRGTEQVYNVALALAIINKLQNEFPVSVGTIKLALIQTKLIGRFQLMPGTPQIVFEVAHNPQAVQQMIKNMVKLPFAKKNLAVFGIANDKDVKQIVELSHNYFDNWYIAKLDSERGLSNCQLKANLLSYRIQPNNIYEFNDIATAMKNALQTITKHDRIVCFGSFLTVESAYNTYITHKG
ncbi:MAG: bifunctional folylpolyglutamate synthase/dihydrofolate synthase [Burkholderiales bacterium]|nr:bifunctional folylpolyglutamate synthase/dihydrofolate synthase [Burkholderiales bacterium]